MNYSRTTGRRKSGSKSTYLAISLFANLALAAMLVALFLRKPEVRVADTEAPAPVSTVSAPSPTPLRWGQLSSSDYSVYARNLRSIDCPEDIITKIMETVVAADLDAKAKNLQQQGASAPVVKPADSPADVISGATTSGNRGQSAVDTGSAPESNTPVSAPQSSSTPAAATPHSASAAAVQEAPLPVVLAKVDPALNLNPEQLAALESLRDDFVKEVGATTQNPNDPTYLATWEASRKKVDEIYRTWFGDEAYGRQVQQVLFDE